MASHPSAIHPADPFTLGTLYSTQDVATLLHVSQRTVQVWIRTGQLTAVRYGRLLRVRQADLAAFGAVVPRRTSTTGAADASPDLTPAGAAGA